MKGIKRFYKEHRVFTILMAIALVCLIIIATVLIQLFYVGGGKNKYGNRLDGIQEVEISSDRFSKIEGELTADKKVKSANINLTGKIIYIKITFVEKTDLLEAKTIASKSLEKFSDKEKKFYDFNFTLSEDSTTNSEGFLISGAKNKNGSGLVWNNNRAVEESTD